MAESPLTLLCLSHLNWDHVWQRPQQLMTRFIQHCRVIYVDPPELRDDADQPFLEDRSDDSGVQVLRPIFPTKLLDTPGNSYQEQWLQLLPETLERAGSNIILWVFSPLADYLVEAAKPKVQRAVYDCMDDLASFRTVGEPYRERETHLLELVDLVFTGGYSMYQSRRDRHPNVHLFPSGVDIAHYQKVQDPATEIPEGVLAIPEPRLGYFGVLDERIDWDLIATVAEQRPQWQWALVGPTAKVDPAELPRAANIHYLGQQPYTALPSLLKSFTIATMPFALNEATRFISPTKTLEYLAGHKPVISSSVPDVVAFYRDIVFLADGPDAWISALEQILNSTPEEHTARFELAAPILERGAWDNIAERMWALMIDDR